MLEDSKIDILFKQKDLKKDIKLVDDLIYKQLGNDFLSNALKPLVKAKSKRLRPTLMFLIKKNNKHHGNLVSAAAAFEILHISSLIHDDIMDEAYERRSIKTINKTYGNEQAILAGDYFFTKAYLKLSELDPALSKIMMNSFLKICQGQSLELRDSFNINRTKQSYLKTIKLKTAELFASALEVSARINKYNNKEIELFKEFGINFGLMFQIIDDLGDFFSSSKLLSKPTFNDIKEGNYSYPILIALSIDKQKTVKYLKAKNPNKKEIVNHLIEVGALNESIKLVYKYMDNSLTILDDLSLKNKNIRDLKTFPKDYLLWSIKSLFLKKYRNYILDIIKGLDMVV